MKKLISLLLSTLLAIFIAAPSYSDNPLPPGYVPPNPNQFNSDGMLAFTPDGRPLAGFNPDGSVNRNLVPPTDPTGIPGGTKLPLSGEPSPTPTTIGSPTSGCLDLGTAYKGTGYEVNFGTACGASEISKMWKVIADYAAWVSTQPNQQPSPKPSIPTQPTPSPTTAAVSECVDLGTAFKNTQYEVKFGQACGKAEKEKMWSVIADYSAWVSTQPPAILVEPKDTKPEEIKEVERIVNEQIARNLKVSFADTTYDDAIKAGALAFFGERYPEKVKVYEIGDFSKEICGGPHIENTTVLGRFSISREEASSAGVRRIYAILS